MDVTVIKFPIVIYPSEDDSCGRFTAHCLNMDIVAAEDSVEGAVSSLLEAIDAALSAAVKYNANPFRDAPPEYWDRLGKAKRLPEEMRERIIFRANAHSSHSVDVESQCDLRLDELQSA